MSWRLGNLLVAKLPPLCSPLSPIPLPLRSAAAPPGARAAPGRSRGAPCSLPSSPVKGSSGSSSAMLTGTTLAGLMTGASFGPPKSLLGLLGSGWPQKIAAQGPRLQFRLVVLASTLFPLYLLLKSCTASSIPVFAALDHHHSFYALSVVLLVYPRLFAVNNAYIMPPKKSSEDILQRAREKGSESNKEDLNRAQP